MRRGQRIERCEEAHFRYLWAAYSKGAFESFPVIKDGWTPEQFIEGFLSLLISWIDKGGDVYCLFAETKDGDIPVGLCFVGMTDWFAEPHVIWFPWASNRNKLECTIGFLVELKKRIAFFIPALEKDVPFFRHVGKYGLLRQVGKWRDWPMFKNGENAVIFQSVGN